MEQALALIAAAKETRATRLDLGNCGLTEVPDALFELTWLEELILGKGWLEYDFETKEGKWSTSINSGHTNELGLLSPRLSELVSLKKVHFDYQKQISDLSPLKDLRSLNMLSISGTQVSDLSPLKDLRNLNMLIINETEVSDLSPLKDLRNLNMLIINETEVSDLSPLKDLCNLNMLVLNETQVSDLTPLKDLSKLNALAISGTLVSDLTPLQHLINLESLDLSKTQVSELTLLKSLPNLRLLSISSTQLSDLTPLKDLLNLNELDVKDTSVSDLSALEGLLNLNKLYVSSTTVSDLTPLKDLHSLNELDVKKTAVNDLSPLKGLHNLNKLNLSSTTVSDLTPLKELSNLHQLDVGGALVSELTPLKDLVNLQELYLFSTQVSDLAPLKELINLQQLDAGSTQVSDLTPLRELVNLRELYISSTQVSDLASLKELINLQQLDAGSTQVGDLTPLKSLDNLQELYISSTQVSDLTPLKGLINLQQLDAGSTQVSDLTPLKDLVNLQELYLFSTQVSDLTPLKYLINLQQLDVSSTQVSDITPLRNLVKLLQLYISSTQVNNLVPLEGMINLKQLYFFSTKIKDLTPLKDLGHLQELYGSNTQVNNLTPLKHLASLQKLYIPSTKVNDLTPLKDLNNLQQLNISFTQVGDFGPLKKLTSLQELYAHSTQASDLIPLSNLPNLKQLDISSTQVSDLIALKELMSLQELYISSTQVSDLTPLKDLINLRKLNISSTQVDVLTPLKKLANLQQLDVFNTQVSDLTPLKEMTNLQQLAAPSTQVNDLTPLKNMTNLQQIVIFDTPVSDITPLMDLVNLKLLAVDSTQVTDLTHLNKLIIKGLPIKWENVNSWEDVGIYVKDCPIDKALIAAIKKSQKAVLRYFEQPTVPLYEARVLVLGEPRAGKTTLRRKLKNHNHPMPTTQDSTKAFEVEIDPYTCSIDKDGEKQRMTYNLWDFGGQDYYRLLHQLFVSEQSVYVIVTDTDRNKNEEEIDFWLETIQRLGRDKNGRYGPVLLLQNPKTNREGSDFWDLKKRYPFWQQDERFVINLNALSEGTESFNKQELAQFKRFKTTLERSFCQLDHVGKQMPADWVKVRNALTRYEKDNWITTEKFNSICTGKGIRTDEIADLLDIFHTLGYVQHYKNTALQGMVVLKREWVTDALYRVLDDAIVQKNKGWFRVEDAQKIWFEPQYENRTRELLALMQEFKLSYLNEASQKYIVPAKLPEDTEGLPEWDTSQNVRLHLQYDWLPRALPIQLIVSLHDNLVELEQGKQWIWRRGAVLDGRKLDLTNVQVRIFENWRENKIEISARGEHSEVLLRTIMAAWRKVHEPFQDKVAVQKQILCACPTCQKAARPFVFEYEDVLKSMSINRRLQCNKSFDSFNASSILKGLFDNSMAVLDILEKQGHGIGKELYDLIAANKLEEVFDTLTENGENEWVVNLKRRYAILKGAQIKNTMSYEQRSHEESKLIDDLFIYLRNRNMYNEMPRSGKGLVRSEWLATMYKSTSEFSPVFNIHVKNDNKNVNIQKNDTSVSKEIAELKSMLAQLNPEIYSKLKDFVETLPEPDDESEKESTGKQILRWLNKNAEGLTANVAASVYYDVLKGLLGIG